MLTHNSNGGPEMPGNGRRKVNILLIGSRASDADEIKRELGIITGLACSAWYCSDPAESVEFLRRGLFNIDIIFLDLSVFNADYPKEYFLQVKQSIPDIPIVVLTARTDYDLMQFVMEEGAADNVSQWQLRTDSDRLRNIVESCMSRDKISKKEQQRGADELKDAHRQGNVNLSDAQDRNDAVLKKVTDSYAVNLQLALDENVQLSRDNFRGASALQGARDQAVIDLRQANDTNDAILKYAQDKGALDVKKVSDENKELRKENDHAREWLSGNYSVSRPHPPERVSANENETDKPN